MTDLCRLINCCHEMPTNYIGTFSGLDGIQPAGTENIRDSASRFTLVGARPPSAVLLRRTGVPEL